jgi:hypothetical protein
METWFVAPQAASYCFTVAGMPQWLCALEGRWQIKVRAVCPLRRTVVLIDVEVLIANVTLDQELTRVSVA